MHAVQFYEDDAFLADAVSAYVRAGVDAGESVVLIATAPHRAAFGDRLGALGVDLDALARDGRVVVRDAAQALDGLLVDGQPDSQRFMELVASAVIDAGPGRVRVYGEVVDLLWRSGRPDAALKLEEMWNELGRTYRFSLLCAYVLKNFPREADLAALRAVCGLHTHVHHAETLSLEDTDERRREIVLLQQRACALETEIQLRKQLEAALRDSDRRKDELFAVLGHDLRDPLAPILTALQLMKLRGDSSTERERGVIERQVRLMMRLVDDLLDASRVTRGKVDLRSEIVEIASVVARAVEMTSSILEPRGHQLEVSVGRRGLLVDADPERLAQVISKLLANAAKFSEPRSRIDVSATREGAIVALRVEDEGAGLDAAALPAVFDGLSLAVARSLVELHGGTLTAESDGPGEGSTFTVRLPAAARTDEAWRPPARRPSPPRGARVLVAVDDPDAAELIAEGLRLLGHDVRVAGDGASALKLAAGLELDAVVLEGGDVRELADRLREQAHAPLRVIAISGYERAAPAAGIDVLMVKPIDLEALGAAIAR